MLILLSYPIFFEVYRTMIFNAVPRDDYAPFLLYLTGDGGSVPGAPMGYRFISVLLAVPFYYVLPEARFTLLSRNVDAPYLRATEALSFASFLFMTLGVVLIFRIARDRFGCSLSPSLAAGLLGFSFYHFTALPGVDPVAIFFIAAGLYFLENRILFSAIILTSAFVNEKVFIVYVLLFLFRTLFGAISIKDFALQKVAVALTACMYFLARRFIALPGHLEQLTPSTYVSSFLNTLRLDVTPKGIMLNTLPFVMVVAFCLLLIAQTRGKQLMPYWSAYDLSVPFALFVIGHIVDLNVTVGRVVMHCFPLFLPAIAVLFERHDVLSQRSWTVDSSEARR
jgi:hypothetical protein